MWMKKAVLGLSLLVLGGCGSSAPPSDGTAFNKQKVIEMGNAGYTQLNMTLRAELDKAIAAGGPVNGVQVCSTKALALTAQIGQEIGDGVKIKRTSFKYRNPANAPDQHDKEALQYFEKELKEKGELPTEFVQPVPEEGTVRYYKALVVQPLCLKCHGDPAAMSDELRATLKERYPDDKATGFKDGDLRGLVRVSIPESLAR